MAMALRNTESSVNLFLLYASPSSPQSTVQHCCLSAALWCISMSATVTPAVFHPFWHDLLWQWHILRSAGAVGFQPNHVAQSGPPAIVGLQLISSLTTGFAD